MTNHHGIEMKRTILTKPVPGVWGDDYIRQSFPGASLVASE